MIIDQYFSLASNPVLREMFNYLQSNQQTASITLVTSINTSDPATVFEREYKNNFEFIPSFKLVVVPSKFFHDRYFFTEFGALKSGQGFGAGVELGTQADKLSINLCGKAECQDTSQWLKQIIDDGRGGNRQRLQAVASEKRMWDSSRGEISDSALTALIIADGVSTAATVSEISGRGVGLAALQVEVENLPGSSGFVGGLDRGSIG